MIDPLEDYPGYLLRRASAAALTDLAGRLEPLNLRPSEGAVLQAINANPGTTQSDIGRLLDIASANMAPLASRLESRNLIEREAVDGRSHGLVLTAAGRALTARVAKAFAAHEVALLKKIPAAHRSAFLKGLQAIWSGWYADKDVRRSRLMAKSSP